jgi:hypothetical protein
VTGAADGSAAPPARWVAQRCLAGLAQGADALAGGDPAAVCRRFAAWKRSEGRRAWPWLPGLAWEAVEPLGVAFPAADRVAVTLGRFLVGVETNPQRVEDALAAVQAGQERPAASRILAGEREQGLLAALDAFWAAFARTAAALRPPVVDGDRARADAVLLASRRGLEAHARDLEAQARRLAAGAERPTVPSSAAVPLAASAAEPAEPPPSEAPLAPGAPGPASVSEVGAPRAAGVGAGGQTVHPEATGLLALDAADAAGGHSEAAVAMDWAAAPPAGMTGEGAHVRGRDDAPAVSAPQRLGSAPPQRVVGTAQAPPGDVEYRTVREHRFAPVVFLAGATLLALVWLLVIATGNA